jgi:hypothetical protein
MIARIHKPARTAMQSGQAKSKAWVLTYEPERARTVEPLMGYTSSADMRQQLVLTFDTVDEAMAYCQRNGIPYRVEHANERTPKRMSYSDNFKFNRAETWTH